jgi:geranylgeranyl diphosphate synthase, type II
MSTDPAATPSGVLDVPAAIKAVPPSDEVRAAIRAAATRAVACLDRGLPPTMEALGELAGGILAELALPAEYTGFTMVACDNAFWEADFAAVPAARRVLLLPRCLTSEPDCQGQWEADQLTCGDCGACVVPSLAAEARALGYGVVISEGTSSVVDSVLDGTADAVLGVACLDSLEKSFDRIADLGIPHQAVPLLSDGCRDTSADLSVIRALLAATGASAAARPATLIPLLRETAAIFDDPSLDALLEAAGCAAPDPARGPASLPLTDSIAREWLLRGGKRLRPFITVSACAVARHGRLALEPDAPLAKLVPPAVRALAVAIEALHKASLVHDDLEDGDALRYGQPTVHSTYGVPAAVNAGDFLVGLGYRLIAAQAADLGPDVAADILAHLSRAHLQLCRGQGMELLWQPADLATVQPLDALRIGALKTAPAFEAALYAGLRAGGAQVDAGVLRTFATHVGEAFQVLNDLAEWEPNSGRSGKAAGDLLAGRPTILRALANEAGRAADLAALDTAVGTGNDPAPLVRKARELYESCGARARAEALYGRLRERALELAGALGNPDLQALLRFLVRNVLTRRPVPGLPGQP